MIFYITRDLKVQTNDLLKKQFESNMGNSLKSASAYVLALCI